MNIQETAQVLAKIQLGDNRQVDELTVREWHDTIGHLEFVDAIAAVKEHRQMTADYLMPAHVIGGARRSRERRAREARIDRQLTARDEPRDEGLMERTMRRMLDDPAESEASKAWIRRWFEMRGIGG
ncbi:hypothetical protein [Gulosibacter molinativorax]|uniref:Uncharacterized protein n=1 Tax=Gulosibacter molinativorax TaxID=256821 RepID=A0ABT7C630_9MICO|nr:hypothetical protein [Gulosibacter molinativorax]MDJ1370656.1 hypothetical protein [Gulosibacter molinativorax]QUY63318.1 Hypotetical protein [Gulosibacter molinativorax]